MDNFTDLTKEQLELLNGEYLYFGSPIKHTTISSNKFLTLLPGIASIFVIDTNDLYQGINKYYNFISFGFDLWNKSPEFLKKKQSSVKIYNNAKDWIKTKGTSKGFIHKIKLTDYIKNNLKILNNGYDVRYEVVYTGKKEIKVDSTINHTIEWTCTFSEDRVAKYGPAGFIGKYEPPYSIEVLKEKYPKLLKDPVHVWRAKTGIELIHKEPTYEEQKRIFYNWLAMSDEDKKISDKQCKKFFNKTNINYHNYIMENYWHDENYADLSKFRLMYNLRDMETNGLKYIHISRSNKPLILKPSVPKKILHTLENDTIPRICVFNSIFGAISAINAKDTYYVHLVEPTKILDNPEVLRYVPDAATTGECWVLDDEIKTTVIGKIEITDDLHMVYKFARKNKLTYYDIFRNYNFIPYESLTKRTARRVLLN